MAATLPAPVLFQAETLPPEAPPYRFTREEYLQMGETGAFGDRTFELLDGELYEKMGTNFPHRSASRLVVGALRYAFGEAYDVNSDLDLPLGPRSQPKPDVTVLRGTARDFAAREEGPEDVALLVEVVDTREDTARVKIGLYARAAIPEYWILDVNRRTLTVLREPENGAYRISMSYDETKTLRPSEVSAGEVAVADLLPSPPR